jgi:tetratricopeptide (TPR) repeat protein
MELSSTPATSDDAALLTTSCSVETLLAKAEDLLTKCQYELAGRFYERALEIEPTNLTALDGLGSLLLEIGELDAAREVLIRSVRLAPERGAEKYLNLAQLLNGLDAIACFRKAIELLITERATLVAEVRLSFSSSTALIDIHKLRKVATQKG